MNTADAMSTDQQFRIKLPRAMAEAVRAKVASGAYATASEMAVAGLRLLLDRGSAFDDWLRTDAAAAHDKLQSDPSRAVGASPVKPRLAAARQKTRTKA